MGLVKEKLREIVQRFLKGQRRGLVLTAIALLKLRSRGEEATLEKIVDEARRILERTRGEIEWGVKDYDENKARQLLQEPKAMGVIEEVDGKFRFSRRESSDPLLEAAEALAPIIARIV